MKVTVFGLLLAISAMSASVFAQEKVILDELVRLQANQNQFYLFKIDSKEHQCEELKINGFMFGHSHGLPTEPKISSISAKHCLLEGIYFNMPGMWKINITDGNTNVSSYFFNVN